MNFARKQTRVVILIVALPALAIVASAVPSAAQDAPLEQLLTKEEQAKLGVASMSPEKREAIRRALIRTFREGYRAGQGADRPGGIVAGTGVVETQVDGDFNGWEGKQQSSY